MNYLSWFFKCRYRGVGHMHRTESYCKEIRGYKTNLKRKLYSEMKQKKKTTGGSTSLGQMEASKHLLKMEQAPIMAVHSTCDSRQKHFLSYTTKNGFYLAELTDNREHTGIYDELLTGDYITSIILGISWTLRLALLQFAW